MVDRFIGVRDKAFACVTWLSKPEYPYAPNRLVVRARILPPVQQDRLGCVLDLEMVCPCTVTVGPAIDGVHFYLMREKGYDRVGV